MNNQGILPCYPRLQGKRFQGASLQPAPSRPVHEKALDKGNPGWACIR